VIALAFRGGVLCLGAASILVGAAQSLEESEGDLPELKASLDIGNLDQIECACTAALVKA
jgi:hypothetical protein